MLHRLVVVALVSLGPVSSARADVSAYSCEGPTHGAVRATVAHNACTGFVVTRPGARPRTVVFPFRGSGTLLASADGRTVAMVQTYLHGRVDKGQLVELVDGKEVADPIGVYVYRDGKLVARHTVRALVARIADVEQSISHVRWVNTMPTTIGKTFTLEMINGRSLEIDARTGRIAAAIDPEARRP